MRSKLWGIALVGILGYTGIGQKSNTNPFKAGYTTLTLIDSSRTYKTNTKETDPLHYRPLELDIWYPSSEQTEAPLLFKDLWIKYEERSNRYQDEDYTGISEELALYLMAGFGIDVKDASRLLNVTTHSYENAAIAKGSFPLVVYMAGYNGMGVENYTLLEDLAEKGFIVVSIWSMGRYPGQMTNDLLDTMEQVDDADFALRTLKQKSDFPIDFDATGILGYSWGGMSSAILLDRYPKVKAFVSLDGSETHYFGESDIDDNFLTGIHTADVLHPEMHAAAYLALESGNKLAEFRPTGEYHYYKKTEAPKFYLRNDKSMHEDFGSFASTLEVSQERTEIYNEFSKSTVLFFQEYLMGKKGFKPYYQQLIDKTDITHRPFSYNTEVLKELYFAGSITDAKTKTPLPYVNMGLLQQPFGTVSKKNGEFELRLNEGHVDDTLRLSMIGYQSKTIPIKQLLNRKGDIAFELEEEISELNEVVVTAKKWRYKTLGNKTKSKFIGHLFYYEQLGKEMGVRMNVGRRPTFVDAFHFHISYNRFSAKSFFRLNVYDASNRRNLLKENIIISVDPKQTGVISTDLKPYDIILTEDVIVTLEWIDNEGEVLPTEALVISVGLFTGGTYERNSKQQRLKKKLKGLGVGFTMDVRY